VKAIILPLVAIGLLGCAGTDYGTRNLALVDAAKPGAREALQQQINSPGCSENVHREPTKLADTSGASAVAVAFVVPSDQFAQLDDPTKDWTREQQAGPGDRCPPKGRKHRNFA
jgi:hypothetical protein